MSKTLRNYIWNFDICVRVSKYASLLAVNIKMKGKNAGRNMFR